MVCGNFQVFTMLMKMLLNPPGDPDTLEEEGKEASDLAGAIKLLHDFAPCIEPFRVSF